MINESIIKLLLDKVDKLEKELENIKKQTNIHNNSLQIIRRFLVRNKVLTKEMK